MTFLESDSIMESFAKLMCVFGASRDGIDFVAALPIEIAELILLKLDALSLLKVASVSRKWMNICRGCCRLRKIARHHLRNKKRLLIQDDLATAKRNKKQTVSRSSRMQTDLAQRLSRQGSTLPIFSDASAVMQTSTRNSRMDDKRSVPHVPMFPTRSTLRLR